MMHSKTDLNNYDHRALQFADTHASHFISYFYEPVNEKMNSLQLNPFLMHFTDVHC